MATQAPAAVRELTPFVPRLVVEWAREDPDARWRVVDGTLAFVDISGFTRMSEKLSGLGKAGAEEVTDVMNATFSALLDVAYARGGGLLKFGGDALLLLFDGPDHARRAASAAWGMRAALRRIGRPRTSAGLVQLRMHVGIHSGEHVFFLLGESHRELIVSGPGATRTVEMEATAEAGEILASLEAAALLPARALAEPKGTGRLLAGDPGGPDALEPLPDLTGLDLAAFVPAPVREQIAAGETEAEHRHAAVAFLHFGGIDALLIEDGPTAAADALEEVVLAVQGAADEHDVCFLETDIDADGGKVVLTAGAPRASENDEERLLRTVRAIADFDLPLPVRIGVNRGSVFAGEVGASFRRTYTILGGTAATAARLMSKAEPGQVLAASDVLERSRTRFRTTELPPLLLKGKARPIAPLELGELLGTRETRPAQRAPLVGRQRELAILSAAIAPVRAGFGTLVELVGDAGIGKSRLVEELRAQAADATVLGAACQQYESSTPYFAFRDLLRSLLGVELNGSAAANSRALRERLERFAPDLVPWIPVLALPLDVAVEPTPEADDLEPAFRRARLHGVVGSLCDALLSTSTFLFFEDVHWMDEASSDLLRHLAAQVSSRPWLVCATRRPVEGGFSAAEGTPPLAALTLRLEPLAEDDAKALVQSVAEDGLPPHEIAAITERAGGNPLFLEELVSSRRAADAEEELPETVEAVVAARIDALAPADRALLRWASALGTAFMGDLVLEVLEGDASAAADSEAWDRLAEFVERDTEVAGGFRFRHALIRDASYEGLPFRRRRELHARVGEVLERRYGDAHSEELSLHFSRAQVHSKTWRYSVAAGERAQAKFANVEAAGFYRRALDAARRLPDLDRDDLVRVWESLGDVSELAGLYREAAEAYRKARRIAAAEGAPQPALLLKEGVVQERLGHYADALRWYGRGLAAADELTDAEERAHHQIRLRLAYAGVRLRQGLFSECIRWCQEALGPSRETDDLPGLAHAYYLLHLAHTSLGSPERQAFRGLALPIYEELGDLRGQANTLNNLGIDAYYEGRWDEARELWERSKHAFERIGDVAGAATIANNIGEILSDQGSLDEAEELFDEATRTGTLLVATAARSNLGRLAARGGRPDDAARLLGEALEGFHEMRAASFVLETEARLAESALLAGSYEEAFRAATQARERAVGPEGVAVLPAMLERVRGYALLALDDLDGASACLHESLRQARAVEARFETALTLEALAELERRSGGEAEAYAAEARTLLGPLGVVATPRIALDAV